MPAAAVVRRAYTLRRATASARPLHPAAPQTPGQGGDAAPGDGPRQAGGDDDIGQAAFAGIRQLAAGDGGAAGGGHAGAGLQPTRLDEGRRRDHADGIDQAGAAAFEQQRHLQHRQPGAAAAGVAQEPLPLGQHQRMHRRLQRPQQGGIGEDGAGEDGAIHPPRRHRRRHQGGDRLHRSAAGGVEAVDGGVGIVHQGAAAREHRRHGGLAHGDGTGQPQDEHRRRPAHISRAMWSRATWS